MIEIKEVDMDYKYCKGCSFCDNHCCRVYAGRLISDIEVCPITTMYYNDLSPEGEFVLAHNPELFTRWVSKQLPIKQGDSVITLRNGFGGPSGKKLTVARYDQSSKCWILKDAKDVEYFLTADAWYLGVVKELLPEKELNEALEELELLETLVEDVNVDRYSDSVYNSFRKEVCYYCQTPCTYRKIDIYKCPKFENYFEI